MAMLADKMKTKRAYKKCHMPMISAQYVIFLCTGKLLQVIENKQLS